MYLFLNEKYKIYIKIEIKKDKMKIKTIAIFKYVSIV